MSIRHPKDRRARSLAGAVIPFFGSGVAASRPTGDEVYRRVRDAVLEGALEAGTRLPSTRALAMELGVSRAVTERAFGQLESEGLVVRRHGSGTFVTGNPSKPEPLGGAPRMGARTPTASERGVALSAWAHPEPRILQPFNAAQPEHDAFNWQEWERCWLAASRESPGDACGLTDPSGLPVLREAIAAHLRVFRGVRCAANQILVVNSSQQALMLIALLVAMPGARVVVEDPGYPGAYAAFQAAGAEPVPVSVDSQGLIVKEVDRVAPDARIIYVTPSHQYPTGVTLSASRRLELIEWAARGERWIIEDDYEAEFRYAGNPLVALQSAAGGDRTIYVGTFSKAMFLALRLAYIVLPVELVEAAERIRVSLDGFTAAGNQLAMSRFMRDGLFAAHLRRMRKHYQRKRNLLVNNLGGLQERGWEPGSTQSGLFLTLLGPDSVAVERAVAWAPEHGLALERIGQFASSSWVGRDGLKLGFGGLADDRIVDGAARLCALLRRVTGARA